MGGIISVVVPCYNEQEVLPLFMQAIRKIELDFEFIFVDDGADDGTLAILRDLAAENPDVRYISFSRNFGKDAALLAGLEAASGDFVAVMDADLQDPPALLPEMLSAITDENFDIVATRRVTRKGEPPIRSFFARRFYGLINKISDTPFVDGARDFRLMTRQAVNAILDLKEYNRFSKGLFSWVGFSTKWLEFENVPRAAGSTKWNFGKLFLYSVDGITAFSVRPLAIASLFGLLFCLMAFLGIVFIIIRWLMLGDPVAGWASTMTAVLMVGGVQLFCMGILGQYLSKAYLEVKGRPVYVVKERNC